MLTIKTPSVNPNYITYPCNFRGLLEQALLLSFSFHCVYSSICVTSSALLNSRKVKKDDTHRTLHQKSCSHHFLNIDSFIQIQNLFKAQRFLQLVYLLTPSLKTACLEHVEDLLYQHFRWFLWWKNAEQSSKRSLDGIIFLTIKGFMPPVYNSTSNAKHFSTVTCKFDNYLNIIGQLLNWYLINHLLQRVNEVLYFWFCGQLFPEFKDPPTLRESTSLKDMPLSKSNDCLLLHHDISDFCLQRNLKSTTEEFKSSSIPILLTVQLISRVLKKILNPFKH